MTTTVSPGNLIKTIMGIRQWTQYQFALRMGLSYSMAGRLIHNELGMTEKTAKDLWYVLGVPVDVWDELERGCGQYRAKRKIKKRIF